MLRRRAAAAADDAEPDLAGQFPEQLRELGGLERVLRAVGREDGQSRVRHARDQRRPVGGEVIEMDAHRFGAGRAVKAEDVDGEGRQRGDDGGDAGADEERAGLLDRHRDVERLAGFRAEDLVERDQPGLDLEQVLAGFQEDRVGAAVAQALDLFLEPVAELVEADLAKRRQLGPGADGAEDVARPVRGRELAGGLARDPGRGAADFERAVAESVLPERDG